MRRSHLMDARRADVERLARWLGLSFVAKSHRVLVDRVWRWVKPRKDVYERR
jgi:hypothetical protein